jgi:hypothetical protein
LSDHLSGVFDHLDPADFDRTSSAVYEERRPRHPADEFDQFVQAQLTAVRYAFASADGDINPVASLASPTVERMFAPEDDELMRNYIDRLAREARTIGARWLFISKRTQVGTVITDEDVRSDSPEAMRLAAEQGQTQEAVYWYAEQRQDTDVERRHGYLTIVGNHLGELVEFPIDDAPNGFSRILGGSDRRSP